MTNTTLSSNASALFFAVAIAGWLSACSGDEQIIVNNGNAGSGSGGSGSAGQVAAGNAGTAGSSGAPTCVDNPTTPEQFLIRCTDAVCRSFDNAERLGLYQAGQPLPEVP